MRSDQCEPLPTGIRLDSDGDSNREVPRHVHPRFATARLVRTSRVGIRLTRRGSVAENGLVVNECMVDGRWLRKSLVTPVPTATAIAKASPAALAVGERNGSSTSMRTGLYGVQVRRTDINYPR